MRPYYALAALLFLAGCGNEPADNTVGTPVTPMRVETVAVAETDWPSTYEATGTVRARTTATISSKLMGYAREVRAQIGDRVREGQPLVVLDARDLETSVARAEAGREEVKSAIPEAESAVALARSQLDLAQVTFNRIRDLLDKKSITNQEYDEASARWKAAQAALDMARARRTQLDAKMAQIEQDVRAAGIQRGYRKSSRRSPGPSLPSPSTAALWRYPAHRCSPSSAPTPTGSRRPWKSLDFPLRG